MVPANQDEVRLTLMAPPMSAKGVFNIAVEGHALIAGREAVRPAVPAEDMMQAFAYHHLVPSQALEVSIPDRPRLRVALKILDPIPVKIPAGKTTEVRVRIPARAFADNLQLELNKPPEGISIGSVSLLEGEIEIVLHSDAAKIKPGIKGNLIVNIMAKSRRTASGVGKARANQTRVALGTLPAIPFEIVAP